MAQQQRAELGLSRAAIQRQRTEIRRAAQTVHDQLRGTAYRVRREFRTVPYIAMDIDSRALAKLESVGSSVEGIYEDLLLAPTLADSVLQVEADLAHQIGFDGTGRVVVIIGTGVDDQHPFLAGKVTAEACIASSEVGEGGACPNGQATQLTPGAGVGASFTGVAPGASLISIQVFHPSSFCFGSPICALAFTSDIAAALEHVYSIRDQFPISSVNLSLGGGSFAGNCDVDFPAVAAVMHNLRAAGIAPVVLSGNTGETAAITSPACVSSAISVSAVDEDDNVASFASVSNDLDLFAPGTTINSSVPGADFAIFSGTSMAAPHIAGAWAVLDELDAEASIDDQLALLEITGIPVVDNRSAAGVTKPRLRLSGAVGIETPLPIVTSNAPTTLVAWGPETTLVVLGSDFTRSSIVLVDGVPLATTYVSGLEVSATLTTNRLETSATSLSIQVSSPPPGGGLSDAIALQLVQPTLTVSSSAAFTGDPITVTVSNAPGRDLDWLGFVAAGALDADYIEWSYIPTGASSFSWTAFAPAQLGNYEFRLFSNDGLSRITTSATVLVESPLPSLTSISPARVAAFGEDSTVTVDGAGFTASSEVLINGQSRPTVFVGGTGLTVTIPVADLATSASSLDVSVSTPAPGGGVSNVLPLQLAHPALSISTSSAPPGSDVTVT